MSKSVAKAYVETLQQIRDIFSNAIESGMVEENDVPNRGSDEAEYIIGVSKLDIGKLKWSLLECERLEKMLISDAAARIAT